MSIRTVTYYQCVCDWPGCHATAQEGDYAAWADPGSAVEEGVDAGWWVGVIETLHYCAGHPGVWASDLADGLETAPALPYLLIHDGDTGNPVDDGRVTLKRMDVR